MPRCQLWLLSRAPVCESGWQQSLRLETQSPELWQEPRDGGRCGVPRGRQHHLHKPPADPQGPTTTPKGFRRFLKRFREPCCLSGLEGVGVVGPFLLTKPGRLRRATAQGRSGFLLSGASWAAGPIRMWPWWMRSLVSGFSREIEAHCWRLSRSVSQGE